MGILGTYSKGTAIRFITYTLLVPQILNTRKIAKQAGELPNVFKADYGGDSSDKIFALSAAVRTWGLGAAILLIFVAMFLISNTIRITILSRQREIQIMRLVGAKMVTFAGLSS